MTGGEVILLIIVIIIIIIIIAFVIITFINTGGIHGEPCNTNADCADGHYCGGTNQCVHGSPVAPGDPCTRNSQCQVGFICQSRPGPTTLGAFATVAGKVCTTGLL